MCSGTGPGEEAARDSARGITIEKMLRGRQSTNENVEFAFRSFPIHHHLRFAPSAFSFQDHRPIQLLGPLPRTKGTYHEEETIIRGVLPREAPSPSSRRLVHQARLRLCPLHQQRRGRRPIM